jgi:hypothetical protein
MSELKYPVLQIASDGTIYVSGDSASLESANDIAVKKGYFTNQSLLDATGTLRKVRSAKIAQYSSRWRLFSGRDVRVALDLESEEKHLDLDAAKELVLAAINAFPHSWDAMDGSTDQIKSLVRGAESFEKLIHLFE